MHKADNKSRIEKERGVFIGCVFFNKFKKNYFSFKPNVMKHLYAFCFCLFTLPIFSQPGQFFFGQEGHDLIQQAVPAPDGNSYLLGSKGGAANQVWLQKVQPDATVVWERTYPVSTPGANEYGHSLQVLPDGNLLICGQQKADDIFDRGAALAIKADTDGNLIWKRTYANTTAVFDAAPSGAHFLLVGWNDNTGASNSGMLLLVNGEGILQWRLPVDVYSQSTVKRIFPSGDGNFLLLGRANVIGAGFSGIFLQKTSPDGAEIWRKTYDTGFGEGNGSDNDFYTQPLGAVRMPDGTIWVVNPTGYNPDILLMQFSSEGELLERKTYGGAAYNEYPYALNPLADGGWLIAGASSGGSGGAKGFAMRTNASGLETWRKYYGPDTAVNRLFSCLALPGGGFIMAGMSNAPSGGAALSDGWLVKAEANGNALPWKVEGRVAIDIDNDCTADPDEPPAAGWFVSVQQAQRQLLATDAEGRFTFYTGDALTEFTLLPPDPTAWNLCANSLSVNSNSANPVANLTFLAQPADGGCPRTEVSLTQPNLVRCDTANFAVMVANRGTGASGDLLLSLELDPALSILAASELYAQAGNVLEFRLPPMPGLASRNIGLKARLSCSVQVGATHPIVARIGPADCMRAWSGPEFRVNGQCAGDAVRFELRNVGGGGTGAATRYRVLADYLLVADAVPVSLPEGGPPEVLEFPNDGRTWRLELEQAPGFPVPGQPSAVVEGCGRGENGLFSIGYRNTWRFDEEAPEVAATLPPNTTGAPNKVAEEWLGLGVYNLIDELAPLEFTARLRNPLSETAQEAEFFFSFSSTFDLQTFHPLAAGGPVELEVGEDGGLRARIAGLMVGPGEDVALRFRIHPLPDLPPDAGEESNFLINARAYLNGKGPYSLAPGFLNYSALFPEATDPYHDYPPEILEFGGRSFDFGTYAIQSEGGSVFLSGESSSYSGRTNTDGLLIKANPTGQAYWLSAIDLGDGGLNTIKAVVPLPDGGCLAAGNYAPPETVNYYLSDYSAYIARIDGAGYLKWHKKLRPAGAQYGSRSDGIIQTANGQYIVYGYAANAPSGQDHFYLAVDADGNMLWQTYEYIDGSAFQPSRALPTADGGVVFAGTNESTVVNHNVYLQKIDAAGNIEWSNGFDGSEEVVFSDIAPAADGGYMVLGHSLWNLNNEVVATPTLIKVSPEGEVEWEENPVIGPFQLARAYAILPDPAGGFLIGGEVLVDTTSRLMDMLLLKVDENADTLWWQHYGSRNTEWVDDLLFSAPGQLLLWGFNQSRPPSWSLNAVLVRTDAAGNLAVGLPKEPSPPVFQALAFPNPARERVNVLFSPAPAGPVAWRLYNLSGQVVREGKTREETFEIDLEGLGRGLYMLCFPGSFYGPLRVVVG